MVAGANVAGANFVVPQGCPCETIWQPSTIPVAVDDGDNQSIEVGVKFRSDTSGYITGIRFYKNASNTGVHLGNLWSSAGTLLATATFMNESSSGWQQAFFDSPVLIAANTTYVASYFAPAGRYSGDAGFFTNAGVDAPRCMLLRMVSTVRTASIFMDRPVHFRPTAETAQTIGSMQSTPPAIALQERLPV
jgi:hypothetical protein